MKKVVLVILVAVVSMGSAFSQPDQRNPAERIQREIDNLTTELGLTKDQVAKITPIVSEAQKKQAEAFAKKRDAGGYFDRDKMREMRIKMTTETDQKLKGIISADQAVKLEAFRKKQAEERQKRMEERKK
jgi:periplasmic protein CpxP/Spy